MVYLYGGAINGGAGSDEIYDGSNFANNGILLVTFNHRVGILVSLRMPSATIAWPQVLPGGSSLVAWPPEL